MRFVSVKIDEHGDVTQHEEDIQLGGGHGIPFVTISEFSSHGHGRAIAVSSSAENGTQSVFGLVQLDPLIDPVVLRIETPSDWLFLLHREQYRGQVIVLSEGNGSLIVLVSGEVNAEFKWSDEQCLWDYSVSKRGFEVGITRSKEPLDSPEGMEHVEYSHCPFGTGDVIGAEHSSGFLLRRGDV
jgi:hypothetical protein